MRQAANSGYKVYLYFVCTESPEINKFRVKEIRVKKSGHDVPADKIESRYNRSLELMFDAAQLADEAYFFDNSGWEFNLFAQARKSNGKIELDVMDIPKVPEWFRKYYLAKVKALE